MAVVGIDLGTTNTVIAAVRDGRATTLKDKTGRSLLPSVVSYGLKVAPKVGYPARDRRTLDPENTVFSIKRLMGRTFDSEHVQTSIARYPYKLKEGPGKSTLVSCHGQDHSLPSVSALVLQEAVAIAEQRLGERVSDAVITVPANFNDLQRAATKIAGRTAGLEVLRIINEPTAAALAYGYGKGGRERLVVYDFGGGTFDVTLLDLNENVFEVLATAGDTFLGGDDVDRAIMDRMAEALLKENKIDAAKDLYVREQLRVAAEALKIELSARSMAKTRIEDLEFDFTLRRSEFESLMEPLLSKTLSVCQEALDVAGVFINDIDQVLMVGGSTRIPLVRRRVSSFFAKMPQSRIQPDEVVAVGAAIQASILESKQSATHIPAAPLPRNMSTTQPGFVKNDPGEPAKGVTKTGLAGLRKTLAGTGTSPEAATQARPASVLSGLKTLTPSLVPSEPQAPQIATAGAQSRAPLPELKSSLPPRQSVTPADNFESAHAQRNTLSGVGDSKRDLSATPTATTNLGLGQSPKTPQEPLGAPPPRALSKSPVAAASATKPTNPSLPQARPSPERSMFDVPDGRENPTPPAGDGSVTFDLASLEASEENPKPTELLVDDQFDHETTEIFKRPLLGIEPAHSSQTKSTTSPTASADASGSEDNLPVPVRAREGIVELGDSAIFSLADDDNDNLPTAIVRSNAVAGSKISAVDLTDDSGLLGLLDDGDGADELDLPSPTSRLKIDEYPEHPDRDSDLPLPIVRAPSAESSFSRTSSYQTTPGEAKRGAEKPFEAALPSLQTALPSLQTALPSLQTALPSLQAGLPSPQAVLPSPQAALPTANKSKSLAAITASGVAPAANLPPLTSPHQAESNLGAKTAGGLFRPASPFRELVDSVTDLEDAAPYPIETETVRADWNQPSAAAEVSYQQAPLAPPLLLDVTPLSLGVEVVGGYVDRLIERNSPVPCECTRTFATASNNQSVVRVRISQGEESRFDRNTILGEVELSGLNPAPRGRAKINVSFSLDESGMLHVSARDTSTGISAHARLMLAGIDH